MYKNYAAVDFEEIDMTTGLLPAASFAEASKARASFFGSRADFGAIVGGHGVHRRFFAGAVPMGGHPRSLAQAGVEKLGPSGAMGILPRFYAAGERPAELDRRNQ